MLRRNLIFSKNNIYLHYIFVVKILRFMKEKDFRKLMIYSSLFVTSLLTSNILGTKIITVFGMQMPSATIAYAVTYLVTDVVGEIYGKREADYLVLIGFASLIVSTLLIRLALVLPSKDDTTAFNFVFNSTTRVIIGSLSGYIVSQTMDVFIFHKIKNSTIKYKFIRNNVSTIVGQFFDTVIFSFVGFYGVVPKIGTLIWGVFMAKSIIALCDTPFFYFLTRKNPQE